MTNYCPLEEIEKNELWLFDLANKEILERLKKSLQQEATIDLGSFQEIE